MKIEVRFYKRRGGLCYGLLIFTDLEAARSAALIEIEHSNTKYYKITRKPAEAGCYILDSLLIEHN